MRYPISAFCKALPKVTILFISFFVLVSATFGQTVRIVPIGNSITQADAARLSFRYALWKKFIDAGATVDFVGSLQAHNGGTPSFPTYQGNTFDQDHEGHWGWRADEIESNLPTWLQGYDADIALVHLGTNDMIQGQTVASTITELEGIIDVLRADNPNITILLAQVIPNNWNYDVTALNAAIAGIPANKSQANSPVVLVDQFTGFSATTDTYDGVHPNADGEEKMAQNWFDALQPYLTTTPPPPPSTLRIMPLGNSITYDNNIDQTPPLLEKEAYRRPLWDLLQAGNYDVDFVGSRQAGNPALFDVDNEGYPGKRISYIGQNVYNLLVNNPADYVLLHIGTNDLGTNTTAQMIADLENALNEIDRFEADYANPVKVFLAQIILTPGYNIPIIDYNDQMAIMAQQRIANGDDIVLVNMANDAGLNYEILAPGESILSTFPFGGYNMLNGTSMSQKLMIRN